MEASVYRELPKVLLHDHLDGGVRAETLIELAEQFGYKRLPTANAVRFSEWIAMRGRGSLENLLWIVDHSVAVIQSAEALSRVANEAIVDLASDGVVYAEPSFAPARFSQHGLSLEESVEAVLEGLKTGAEAAQIDANLILTAVRDDPDSLRIAKLASAYSDDGVVGIDLAGKEEGYPPSDHAIACQHAMDHGVHVTVHAGEDTATLLYIRSALEDCQAERLGVAYMLTDDIDVSDDGSVVLGPLAAQIKDEQTPLEMCPITGTFLHDISAEDHPLGLFHRAGLAVTVNTDDRLISGSTMTKEFENAVMNHNMTVDDLRVMTLRAADAAFCDTETKKAVRAKVVEGFVA
jgi:adenosine deaminase